MTPGLGYIPDREDPRDRVYRAHRDRPIALPRDSHMWERIPRWRDQEQTSSCVGHGGVGAFELLRVVCGLLDIPLSVLDAYRKAQMYGGLEGDVGAHIRDLIRAMVKIGICSEQAWPFDVSRVTERPPIEADIEGVTRTLVDYERITETGEARETAVLHALADKCPIVDGKQLTDAYFRHAGTNALSPPKAGETDAGGHCTYLAGYRTELGGSKSIFEANSWPWGIRSRAIPAGGWVDIGWVHRCRDLWVLRRSQELSLA